MLFFLTPWDSTYPWFCFWTPWDSSSGDVFFKHPGIPTVVKPSTGWGSNWTCFSFTQWILYMAQSKWPQQRTNMQMLPTSSCGWYSWQCTGVLFFHCLCYRELCSHCRLLETMAITHGVVSWHDTDPNTHFSCVRPQIRSVSIKKKHCEGRNRDRWSYYSRNVRNKLLYICKTMDSSNIGSWRRVLVEEFF